MTLFAKPSRRAFLAGGSAAIIAGAAPRAAWGRTEVDVAIIGAGLAGLNAARICEAAGLSVVVLEAENRIGGRLHTLDDLPGEPDAGGIQIGAGYKRLHTIAGELDVRLSSDGGAGAGRVQTPGNFYAIGGGIDDATTWPISAHNKLSGAERNVEPARLLRHYARAFPRLETPRDWLNAPIELDISVGKALREAGASEEALRLIEANFNGHSLERMSQLHLARTFAIFRSQPGPISTVVGGSQRLPEAMAADLQGDVRLGTAIDSVEEHDSGVTLALRAGAGQFHARHAICTIPFSAIVAQEINIESPNIPLSLTQNMAALPYTQASFAYLSASKPFWQDDEFPDTLWSDEPLIGRVFVLSDGSGDTPPMLKLWTNGIGAKLLDQMPDDQARATIIRRIEAMRPSSVGKLKVERLYSWQKNAHAAGIYHHLGARNVHEHAATCLWQGSRLHFAGEHLAVENSGMEGALESGERAAERVL